MCFFPRARVRHRQPLPRPSIPAPTVTGGRALPHSPIPRHQHTPPPRRVVPSGHGGWGAHWTARSLNIYHEMSLGGWLVFCCCGLLVFLRTAAAHGRLPRGFVAEARQRVLRTATREQERWASSAGPSGHRAGLLASNRR